jgi:alpha-mannosidase
MYEGKKTRGIETLTLGIKAEKAYLCDMLENEISELEVVNGTITLPYKPFEIITVKVK